MLLKDVESSGALQSTDNNLDEDEAQNFAAVWSHILGYGSVIGLVVNIRSHSLDLSTPFPGWQRRELGSSKTVDLGVGPDSLVVGL